MRKLFFIFFILAVSLTARANLITYTDSITGLFDQVPNRDLVVRQFDSSLGTLNSVTMDVSAAIQASLGFENLVRYAGGDIQITASLHGYVVVGYMLQTLYVEQKTYTVTLGAFDGIIDYAGTSGTTVATFSDAENGTFTLGPGDDFSRFIGTGIVPFNIITEAMADHLGMPTNSSAIINTTGQASITVTYDYTHVPEPATIAMLSLCGLLLKRKKT